MKMFTVVIPYFNKLDVIQYTLDSILQQNTDDVTCIIVDDGSQEPLTREKIVYANLDLRIKRVENVGVSSARNIGLNLAETPWLCFIDAGDVIAADFFDSFRTCIQRFPNGQFFTSAFKSCFRKDIESDKKQSETWQSFNYDSYLKKISAGNQLFVICSAMFDTQRLSRLGGFAIGKTHGEDHEMILRYLEAVDLCYFTERTLFYYLQDDTESVTRRSGPVPIYAHTEYLLGKSQLSEAEKNYLACTLAENVVINFYKHQYIKALSNLLKSRRINLIAKASIKVLVRYLNYVIK
jgi:glycosyltransferase involved in cell wall biosynthesis